jgi:PTH1 family peptidyl-tRNA hydrolase
MARRFLGGDFSPGMVPDSAESFVFQALREWLLCACMPFPIIVGLGNPGRQYEATRHNVGFMLMDRLAATEGGAFQSVPRWQCHLAKLPGSGTLLLKPQTFMNLSGRAVQQILAYYKWTPDQMLVVHDDAALPLGTLRFREKGSAGGHNGIKSILQHLGCDTFARLKLGIGGSRHNEMVGHVLGKFPPEEHAELENMLAMALDAVQLARSEGIATAANRFHTRSNPPNPPPDESQIPRPDRP